jgi:ParB-like chromosome segregation protein Spo0J
MTSTEPPIEFVPGKFEPKVKLDTLHNHPENPNQGDLGNLLESMHTNGFYGLIYAQTSTRYVIAGNHRLIAARECGVETLPVYWLDVDDELALRILIADNRATRLGMDDTAKLSAILAELAATDTGLTGTGFDGDDLDAMLADLTNDDVPNTPAEKWLITVTCGSEADRELVMERLIADGYDCARK